MLTSLSTQIILKGMQPLEPFRGTDEQDVTSWLIDLEELFDAAKQKPEERLAIAPTYLAGDAKQWYRVRGPYEVWADFKTALVAAFTSSAHQLKTSSQLYNRRQGPAESVQSYYFDFMRLCTRLNHNMPADERLLHLMRGLKPSLAQTIIMFNPRDCSELLEHGKRAEATAYNALPPPAPTTQDDTAPTDLSAAINKRTAPLPPSPTHSRADTPPPSSGEYSNTGRSHNQAYRGRSFARSYQRPPFRPPYQDSFARGQAFYGSNQQPPQYPRRSGFTPPTPAQQPRRDYRRGRPPANTPSFSCYNCGGHGHRARDCPTPRDHLNY